MVFKMSNLITNLSYDEAQHLVMVKLYGQANVVDIVNIYQKITQFARVCSTRKLLVDVVELEHQYPAIEVINFSNAN